MAGDDQYWHHRSRGARKIHRGQGSFRRYDGAGRRSATLEYTPPIMRAHSRYRARWLARHGMTCTGLGRALCAGRVPAVIGGLTALALNSSPSPAPFVSVDETALDPAPSSSRAGPLQERAGAQHHHQARLRKRQNLRPNRPGGRAGAAARPPPLAIPGALREETDCRSAEPLLRGTAVAARQEAGVDAEVGRGCGLRRNAEGRLGASALS